MNLPKAKLITRRACVYCVSVHLRLIQFDDLLFCNQTNVLDICKHIYIFNPLNCLCDQLESNYISLVVYWWLVRWLYDSFPYLPCTKYIDLCYSISYNINVRRKRICLALSMAVLNVNIFNENLAHIKKWKLCTCSLSVAPFFSSFFFFFNFKISNCCTSKMYRFSL